MDIKELLKAKFKKLIKDGVRNTNILSSKLQSFCYDELHVSSNKLWEYIDRMTKFSDGVDELSDRELIEILCEM